MDTGEDRINLLSKRIIDCGLTVLHALGTGFLEKVHENVLLHELRKAGLLAARWRGRSTRYDSIVVADYG
jgi:GxxExxY protein